MEILGAGKNTEKYFKDKSVGRAVYSHRQVEPSDFVRRVQGFTIYAVDDSNPQARAPNFRFCDRKKTLMQLLEQHNI